MTGGSGDAVSARGFWGRPFVHPVFDVALIGGGLSLVTVAVLTAAGASPLRALLADNLALFVLLANIPHFAASSVRLYSKPAAFVEMPSTTMLLPLATLAAVTLAIAFAGQLGRHVQALYLTWSPFHYAAQTYGLAMMYAMRSGVRMEARERNLLWWACMLPFAYAFLSSPNAGLAWFVPPEPGAPWAPLTRAAGLLAPAAGVAVFAAPAVLFARSQALPAICWLLLIANGLWWVWFTYVNAFGWATVFHGVQYLAIVAIFHVRDHVAGDAGVWPRALCAAKFYAACLGLGYLLFQIWPYAYLAAGFALSESVLLCVAAINIHHFIVDRAIWRIRGDKNMAIVVGS